MKFRIRLVKNIIPEPNDILKEYGTFENESEAIKIAEKEYQKKVILYRKIILSDKSYTIDYGSHCKFILVEEISE